MMTRPGFSGLDPEFAKELAIELEAQECYYHYMTNEFRYCCGPEGEEQYWEWYYSDPDWAGCEQGFTDTEEEVCEGMCVNQAGCTNPCGA